MKLRTEPIYGFYHGQDPRTFSPDGESCTAEEVAAHREACAAAYRGEWKRDDSGCHHIGDTKILKTTMGLGVYHVVMDEDGDFVRDATYEDYLREGEWEEDVQERA